MPDTHRVLRHVKIDGAMRKPGDLVDATNLRTTEALVSQRYLRPLSLDDAPVRGGRGSTPDPKIAQDRASEKAAGREGGPTDDVAADSPVGDTGDKSDAELRAETEGKEPRVLKGKLPDGFPGRQALEAADLATYAKLRKHLASLEDVEGIGPSTATKIRAEFEGASEDHGDENESGGEPGPSTAPKASNA